MKSYPDSWEHKCGKRGLCGGGGSKSGELEETGEQELQRLPNLTTEEAAGLGCACAWTDGMA